MGDSITKSRDWEDTDTLKCSKKECSPLESDFNHKYPGLGEEFRKIQEEQYQLFMSKMMDYGRSNITLGGDLSEKEDREYSLMGIQIRLNDKINRLKNLLVHKRNYVKGEPIEDTFIDVANYGIIGMLVGRKKW